MGPIIEFSDGFDAVGWYTEQFSKNDDYGWDYTEEYPF